MNLNLSTLPTQLVAVLVLILSACASQEDNSGYSNENAPMEGFNAEASDAMAISIADQVMLRLGGRANWDRTRYLSWSFFGDDQVWDKWTGRFRFQEDSIIVLMNVETKQGRVWVNGAEVQDSTEREPLLASAHRNWANSSYWLLMPYKLKDSGVTLRYKGEGVMGDGQAADILLLTFDAVGYTPENRYEVFVDKETKLVRQWTYFRTREDREAAFTTPWQNWKQFGDIMLSDDRGMRNDSTSFVLPNVGVFAELPDAVFENPEPLDLSTLGGVQ